jgi:GNAT superfamily N-acetyltransferase
MSGVRVSALIPEDHGAWLPLWYGYQSFYQVKLDPQVTETTWARLLDPSEPVDGALAWDRGQAVGLLHTVRHRSTWSIADKCYLNDLFVAPDVRGRGVGRRLIEYVYATAVEAGCGSVYWLTHETNATAMELYDRIGRRSGFVQYSGVLS